MQVPSRRAVAVWARTRLQRLDLQECDNITDVGIQSLSRELGPQFTIDHEG